MSLKVMSRTLSYRVPRACTETANKRVSTHAAMGREAKSQIFCFS